MTDTADSTPDAAPASPPPSADGGSSGSTGSPTDAAPVTDAAPATSDSPLDVDLPEGMKTFDRSYVEKIRAEAASNRTKAREAEQRATEFAQRFEAFDGYSDDDMQIWTDMAGSWKQGDYARSAGIMQKIAEGVLGDPAASAADKADAQAVLDDPDITAAAEGLTEEQVREIARNESAAERAERQREEAVENIWKQIEGAGYEKAGPDSSLILHYATQVTEGDIDKAIAMHQQYRQGIIDSYVADMAKGGSPVKIPGQGAGGAPVQEAPKTIAEGRRQAEAWLREQRNAG